MAARTWLLLTFPTDLWFLRKQVLGVAHRCTSSRERKDSALWTPAELKYSPATWNHFAQRSPPKTALSSGHSPIRASLVASATPTQMRFCMKRNCPQLL